MIGLLLVIGVDEIRAATDAAPTGGSVPEGRTDAAAFLSEVAELRSLDIRKPLEVAWITRSEFTATLDSMIAVEAPDSLVVPIGKRCRALGLVPDGFDLRDGWKALFSEQVAGFYDPRRGKFFMVEFAPDDPLAALIKQSERAMIAHELVHALQDQHFGLLNLPIEDYSNEDRLVAAKSIVEGDATLAMQLFAMGEMGMELTQPMMTLMRGTMYSMAEQGMPGMPSLSDSPSYIVTPLLFSYADGMTFVGEAYFREKWPAVDSLFTSPPVSTEQILHPEKYFDEPDLPRTVALDDVDLPDGWSRVETNSLGELIMRIWLEGGVSKLVAAPAAAGWDGDRVDTYEHADGRLAFLWASIWDQESDAEEFTKAATAAVDSIFAGEPVAVSRHEDLVLVARGWPAGAISAENILDSVRVE